MDLLACFAVLCCWQRIGHKSGRVLSRYADTIPSKRWLECVVSACL